MKLYFIPGACSLAPHIALCEANLAFDLIEVDYQTRRTINGHDFLKVSPKGYVPALALDSNELLTEVPVILQYLSEQAPEAGLLPMSGLRRLRSLEWLSFIATELHKSCSPLFRSTTPVSYLKPGKDHLRRRLNVVEQHLQQHQYLMGDECSLADVYLFTVLRWLKDVDMNLQDWPKMHRHSEEMKLRSAVKRAMRQEGLT